MRAIAHIHEALLRMRVDRLLHPALRRGALEARGTVDHGIGVFCARARDRERRGEERAQPVILRHVVNGRLDVHTRRERGKRHVRDDLAGGGFIGAFGAGEVGAHRQIIAAGHTQRRAERAGVHQLDNWRRGGMADERIGGGRAIGVEIADIAAVLDAIQSGVDLSCALVMHRQRAIRAVHRDAEQIVLQRIIGGGDCSREGFRRYLCHPPDRHERRASHTQAHRARAAGSPPAGPCAPPRDRCVMSSRLSELCPVWR